MDAIEIEICADCGMLIWNGESNPDWSEAEDAAHRERVAEWTDGFIVAPGDADKDSTYSTWRCDACHRPEAGFRYHAWLLPA